MNKKQFPIILLSLFFSCACYVSGQNWQQTWTGAVKTAQQDHKKILLNFSGSDWCIPCIRMHKEIFDSQDFVKYSNDSLVLYNADFPRAKKSQPTKEIVAQNNKLADTYDSEGSFPLTLLLDSEGHVLKTWKGFFTEGVDKFIAELH